MLAVTSLSLAYALTAERILRLVVNRAHLRSGVFRPMTVTVSEGNSNPVENLSGEVNRGRV